MIEEPRPTLDEWIPWWTAPGLSATSPLGVATAVFVEHLGRSGAPANTVAAFTADLRLFCRATGCEQPLAELTREQIEAFYGHLLRGEEARCCGRSLRRRATTLQALLRYLADEGVVDAALTRPVARPPERAETEPPLSDDEVACLLEAARQASGEGDSRALLLVLLLLATGMSKGECLALRTDDFDLAADTLTLRAAGAHRTSAGQGAPALPASGPGVRERVLPLAPETKQAYLSFRAECPGEGTLFSCTGRNLEYVLARAGERAGLQRNPSFRLLRATAVARMLARGCEREEVVAALGISPATWPAVHRRLRAWPAGAAVAPTTAPEDEPGVSAPAES